MNSGCREVRFRSDLICHRAYALCGIVLLIMLSLTPARSAPQIIQVNPTTAAPGDTITLTVAGADTQVAANDLINFIQNGNPVGQVAAGAVFPLPGTPLGILTVTIPSGLAPTTRGLTLAGALSLQVGSSGTPGAQKSFPFHSIATPLAVSPSNVPDIALAPAMVWQGNTATVRITGQFTHFRQGVTTANFGPGIQVGGAAAGTPGPVTVVSPTVATASLTAAPNAPVGNSDILVSTGKEQLTYPTSLTINQSGKPFARVTTNTSLIAFEGASGSPQVQASVSAYDQNGNPVSNPSFTLGVSPSTGVTINGSTITFTQPATYIITATTSVAGNSLSPTTTVNVIGAPVAPNAGSGLANKFLNSLGRTNADLNNLLQALQAADNAAILSAATALKTEVNSTDYNGLAAGMLLGTSSDPTHTVSVADVNFLGTGSTVHFPNRSDLSPAQQANDDSYVAAMNAVSAELDHAIALINATDTTNPSNAQLAALNTELVKLTALTDTVAGSLPSVRAMYDQITLVQTVVEQKLPALSRALSQYILTLLANNGYHASTQSKNGQHYAASFPNTRRMNRCGRQLPFLFSTLVGLSPYGPLISLMYGSVIGQIQNMLYLMAAAQFIPVNGLIGITGTVAGLDQCDNTVSIGGGVTYIFGFGFSPTVNNDVQLFGSKAIPPIVNLLNDLLKLTRIPNPSAPLGVISIYNYFKTIVSAWNNIIAALTAGGGTYDNVAPGDPRLSGANLGIDCNGGFTDNTSEVDVAGFVSQKSGTFDFVAILVVRNLDNGMQAGLLVNEF